MSNETQWTPGPWRTEFEQEEEFEGEPDPTYGKLTVESEFGCVALIGPLGPVKDDEDRANARLIAAAPDMFAALQQVKAKVLTQHNFLSTATDQERRDALEHLIDWWNSDVVPLLAKIKG